jgi:hypothetical protein
MGEEYAPRAVDAKGMSVDEEDTTAYNPAVSTIGRDVYPLGDVCLSISPLAELDLTVCWLGGGWEEVAVACGAHRTDDKQSFCFSVFTES